MDIQTNKKQVFLLPSYDQLESNKIYEARGNPKASFVDTVKGMYVVGNHLARILGSPFVENDNNQDNLIFNKDKEKLRLYIVDVDDAALKLYSSHVWDGLFMVSSFKVLRELSQEEWSNFIGNYELRIKINDGLITEISGGAFGLRQDIEYNDIREPIKVSTNNRMSGYVVKWSDE